MKELEGKMIQRAEIYFVENGKARHVGDWPIYVKMCLEKYGHVLDYPERVFLDKDAFPIEGKRIKEWPKKPEPETIWINAKMLWAGKFNVDEVLVAGFNMVMTSQWFITEELLDECSQKGLKVLPNLWEFLADESNVDIARMLQFVKKWKDHSGVFAWYILDEPELKEHATPVKQMEWYNAILNADSNHELFAVFTSNPNYPHKNYNPDAFDHCAVDIYPFGLELHKDPWNGDWRKLMNYCCEHWNSETGGIGGMAVVQASYNLQETPDKPNGHIAEMLDIFREHGIGAKRDGYGMYCWTDGGGTGSVGISEDKELLREVTKVNKEE